MKGRHTRRSEIHTMNEEIKLQDGETETPETPAEETPATEPVSEPAAEGADEGSAE